MLAFSAIFAFVLIFYSDSNDHALGQSPSNADDLRDQVSILETAVANPDYLIDDVKVRADKVAAVNWDDDDDSQTAAVSILPTVSVKASGSATAANATVSDALDPEGSYYGTFWDDDGTNGALTNARHDATLHVKDSEGSTSFRDSAYSGESVAKDVEDLKDATVTVGGVNYSLRESTKSTFDSRFLRNLGLRRNIFNIEEDLTRWKEFLLSEGYYGDHDNDASTDPVKADLTEFGSTTDNVTDTAVVAALNELFTKGTGNNADTGSLVHLKKVGTDAITALEGIKSILQAVQGAVNSTKATIDDGSIADGRFNYTGSGAPADRAATRRELNGMSTSLFRALADLRYIYGVTDLTAISAVDWVFDRKGMYLIDADDGAWTGPRDGVAARRRDNIVYALGADGTDDLNAITNTSDIRGLRRDLLDALKTDLTNHVVNALEELKELDDDAAAQRQAIVELRDLLTKVDDLNTLVAGDPLHQGKVPITQNDNLDPSEVGISTGGYGKVAVALWELIKAMRLKHVDTSVDTDGAGTGTSGLEADLQALNQLDDDDFDNNSTVYARISTLATELTDCLNETDCNATSAAWLLRELHNPEQDGVARWFMGDLVSATDKEVTVEELAPAMLLRIDDNDTANDTSDDTMSTPGFQPTAYRVAFLDDALRYVHDDVSEATLSNSLMDAINGLSGDVEDEMVQRIDRVAANVDSYRGNTLQYDAYAATAALQKALEDVENASDDKLEAAVQTAREALTVSYNNRDDYEANTTEFVAAAYTELITKGSSNHAYAQRAAMGEVNKALTADPDKRPTASMLTANIQTKLKDTQSPTEQKLQARISRIEPTISGVTTVSGGDTVKLLVAVFGVQDIMDQDLMNGKDGKAGTDDDVTLNWGDASSETGAQITYTAPDSPGTYTVKATLDLNECYYADADVQAEKCSASFTVKVRRPSAPQPEEVAPANPPGDIPTILTDGDGNQYEVFTPVEGGTFAGEGYSIVAPSGAVPNGEFIGVRMSDDGAASNLGMTHQRYTLGGNMYGIHAVDGTGAAISDYVLDDPAKVCVPLPDMFRARISDLALVTINSDSTLTILAATVRLNSDGGGGASVCGNLSNMPASVAVGSTGAPDAIPTATPIPTPEPPDTGGTAPSSDNGILWLMLILGVVAIALGVFFVQDRNRRESATSNNNGI